MGYRNKHLVWPLDQMNRWLVMPLVIIIVLPAHLAVGIACGVSAAVHEIKTAWREFH